MDRPMLMAIVVAFMLILLALMFFGWRRRQKRQAGFPRPLSVPASTGAEIVSVESFYVATTASGEPLNRIAVAGLGYRARAVVTVAERGVTLAIPGQAPIYLPAEDIRTVERASWVIDRAVDHNGMVVVRWVIRASDASIVEVDSYLRIIDPVADTDFFHALQSLLGHTSTPGGRFS